MKKVRFTETQIISILKQQGSRQIRQGYCAGTWHQ
jgi:hypothetical protein